MLHIMQHQFYCYCSFYGNRSIYKHRANVCNIKGGEGVYSKSGGADIFYGILRAQVYG